MKMTMYRKMFEYQACWSMCYECLPFSVFKRANRPFYFVSYKDANGKCLSPVSTKKTTEKEAMQVAFAWLRDGVPKKNATLKVLDLSIRDFAKKIKTETDAEALLTELKRSGLVKNLAINNKYQKRHKNPGTPPILNVIPCSSWLRPWGNSSPHPPNLILHNIIPAAILSKGQP